MLSKDQSGFGAVETILVIIIIALAGVVGWFVYDRHNNKTTTPTSSATIPPSTTPTNNTAEQTAASDNVKAFYKGYLKSSPMTSFLETAVTQNQITSVASKSISHIQGYDLPTCSQSPLQYSQYSFSTPVLTDSTGTMTVSGTYEGPPASTVTINLTLQKKNDKWAIDKFSCPNL